MPKSAMAAIALWATGSITPGLGSTWTTCQPAGPAAPLSCAASESINRGSPTRATTVRSTTLSASSSRAIAVDLLVVEVPLNQIP